MAMTKKDYVLIAGTLNALRRGLLRSLPEADAHTKDEILTAVTTIDMVGDDLSDRLATANALFNTDTFRAAVRKED